MIQSVDPDMEHAIALSIADSNVHNNDIVTEVWATRDLSLFQFSSCLHSASKEVFIVRVRDFLC